MACIGSGPDKFPTSFCRTRRPALIPPDCPLSTETEEIVRRRTHQSPVQPPNPPLFQHIASSPPSRSDSTSPDCPLPSIEEYNLHEQSPTSSPRDRTTFTNLPRAMSRGPRRRAAFVKARAQYARDRKTQRVRSPDQEDDSNGSDATLTKDGEHTLKGRSKARLRKHSAFVIDEELQSEWEARADTPHLSELSGGEDIEPQGLAIQAVDVQDLELAAELVRLQSGGSTRHRSHSQSTTTGPT